MGSYLVYDFFLQGQGGSMVLWAHGSATGRDKVHFCAAFIGTFNMVEVRYPENVSKKLAVDTQLK